MMKQLAKRTVDSKAPIYIEIEKGSILRSAVSAKESQFSNRVSDEIILEKKWMDKEEMKEKHLVAAIINNATIPVPDVEEVEQEVYDKLYPNNFKRTNWRIIAEPPISEQIEYDVDSDDDQWLNEQPKRLNLTPEKFEKYFEYLEHNSEKKVPSCYDFCTFFKSHRPMEALEKVYDYWLDKRLSRNGKKLIPEMKKIDKVTAKNKFDPYVAFRPCREKMFLRKNRYLDRENYVKMLRLREQMECNVKMWKNFLVQKRVEHQQLTHQYNTYLEQYQRKNFSEIYASDTPLYNTEAIMNDLKSKIDDVSFDDEPEITLETLKEMDFCYYPFNNYHKPINTSDVNFDAVGDQKFQSTENGYIRGRFGRGGRIVFDRRVQSNNQAPEYQQFNVLGDFNLRRYELFPRSYDTATSSFKLSNSCSHKIDNYEILQDQFYFETE